VQLRETALLAPFDGGRTYAWWRGVKVPQRKTLVSILPNSGM
jgi:hypothetical protein